VEGSFRTVEIRTVSGSIDVTGGGSGGVQVHSVKTAPNQRSMDAIHVDIRTEGDRLIIQEKRDSVLVNWGSISYSVRLPQGVTSVTAASVSGSIELSGVESGIDQVLETTSGSIRTDLARNLKAKSVSGRIDFTAEGKDLYAHNVSGSIDGEVRSMEAGGSIDIGSVSGSVDLKAFGTFEADLRLHSVSGSVSCAFPVTASRQKRNSLEGRIGGGGISVDIGTTSGSISIGK
jgi:DUF4097 and DUF4098 domain-containing protein YvlB